MPWAKFDDRFPSNRKISLLTDRAFRLYVSGVCWCAENLTDGLIRDEELRLVAHVRNINATARELVERQLWVRVADGWMIHDYDEYQPSREQVIADRKKNAARQQRHRGKKNGRSLPGDDDQEGEDNGGSNGVTNGVTNGGSHAAPTRPDPYPSPVGTGSRSSDPQGDAAALSALRAPVETSSLPDRLPFEDVDLTDAPEDPQPVVGTATIPVRGRASADVELAEFEQRIERIGSAGPGEFERLAADVAAAKERHMRGCWYCQGGARGCPAGRRLLGWYAELGGAAFGPQAAVQGFE